MLSNLKNVFKVTDLRNKILFVMVIIALYRLGVAIRVPGIDPDAVKQFKKGVESQGALGFLDLFSGGAFGSFSIFALGIMPYITASIIMQVLGVVDSQAREAATRGCSRSAQDHPVHAVSGHRHLHHAGHGADVHLRQRQRQRLLRCRAAIAQEREVASRRHVATRLLGDPHARCRHGGADVDG